MPRKWRERAARMPPQPRITDSRYSAWRAEVGRLFTWPVFSRYTYVCIYVCMYTHIYKAEVGRLFTWPGFSRYTYVCIYIRMYTHIYHQFPHRHVITWQITHFCFYIARELTKGSTLVTTL
jgi:hypothetical protein